MMEPNEEIFRKKVILEAQLDCLKRSIQGIKKYTNSKESAIGYLLGTAKTIQEEWNRCEQYLTQSIGERQKKLDDRNNT